MTISDTFFSTLIPPVWTQVSDQKTERSPFVEITENKMVCHKHIPTGKCFPVSSPVIELVKAMGILAGVGKYFFALAGAAHAVKALDVCIRSGNVKDEKVGQNLVHAAKAICAFSILSFYIFDFDYLGLPVSTGTLVFTAVAAMTVWKPLQFRLGLNYFEGFFCPQNERQLKSHETQSMSPGGVLDAITDGSLRLSSLFNMSVVFSEKPKEA